MPLPPTIDRRFLAAAAQAIAGLGVDAEAGCVRAGIAWPLAGDAARIDLALVAPVYELITRESPDPAWNFHAVNAGSLEGAGTLFQLMMCCETLDEVFRLGCRFASLISDSSSFSFRERDYHVDLIVTPTDEVYIAREQVEVSVFIPARYQRIAPAARTPLLQEVWLRHPPRFDEKKYEALFGCPVRFGAPQNGMRLSREGLATAMPGGDIRRKEFMLSVAERYECELLAVGTLVERVQLLFMQRMAFGEPTIEDISTLLAMGKRTLQRRLIDEGSSWRVATDAARMRVAHRELADSARPLNDVALLTGYADTRAFRRAFQRWAGMTPGQYRARQTF